ncbi:hypothetical protein [Gorillibacterium sp. CAU 1737]|uniref:TolB family protein n=1 Tax=Gorillibacterium sp. CAU 1737 TaxID=3140362 RepID=UPI003260099A
MRVKRTMSLAAIPVLVLSLSACNPAQENRTVIKDSGGTITVVESPAPKAGSPELSVERMERLDQVEITDWLDEDTVIVSKENDALEKISLAELSEFHPKSLYSYNLSTKQYRLLKEKKGTFLGGAVLSPDKKHLLYHDYTLGDPIYSVLNLNDLTSFAITGEPVAGAISAHWADSKTVIGVAYSQGAYLAQTSGELSLLPELNEEGLFIVRKGKENVYYNTTSDETLRRVNLATGQKTSLNIGQVRNAIPSPDGTQLLVLQYEGSQATLTLMDENGQNHKKIAQGTELDGAAWSPDQRLVAYTRSSDSGGTSGKGLYVYDRLTAKSIQIAVGLDHALTAWSPSSKALVYTESKDNRSSSTLVYLKDSLKK